MRPDKLFIICLLVVLVAATAQYWSMREIIREKQQVDANHPRFTDLWACWLVAAALWVLRYFWLTFTTPIAKRLIPQTETMSVLVRDLKVKKFAVSSFKAIYFLVMAVWGFVMLRSLPFFPKELGGSGTTDQYFVDSIDPKVSERLRRYYYLNGGYHIAVFMSLLVEAPLPDFWESALQGVLATTLIAFSYASNYLAVGSVLMHTHDVSNIFLWACKTFVDTTYKPLTLGFFSLLMLSWAYLRLLCLPKLIFFPVVKAISLTSSQMNMAGWSGFLILLLCLLMLNIYWFTLMIRILWHFVVSGQTSDLHSRVSDVDFKTMHQRQRGSKQTVDSKKVL